MKSIFRLLIIVFTLLLTLDVVYAGGGNRTGTGGAAQLLIPVGPRGIAMGEANVSTAYGVEALFWNPAGVAKMDHSAGVMFSHMSYIADIGVEYGVASANFDGFGVVSLSIKTLAMDDILVTTTQDPDGTGATFKPQILTAGLSYSRQLTERIAVGLTANFVTETLGDVSASGVAFNIGVIYDNLAELEGLSIGLVLKNVGPEMKFDGPGLYTQADVSDYNRPPSYYKIDAAGVEMPSTFEMGLGYKAKIDEANALQFSGMFQHNNFSDDEYKVGAEYGYNNTFFVRAGYLLAPDTPSENYLYGLTAGAGVNVDLEGIDLKIDYAYRYTQYFDGNHIFALSLGF